MEKLVLQNWKGKLTFMSLPRAFFLPQPNMMDTKVPSLLINRCNSQRTPEKLWSMRSQTLNVTGHLGRALMMKRKRKSKAWLHFNSKIIEVAFLKNLKWKLVKLQGLTDLIFQSLKEESSSRSTAKLKSYLTILKKLTILALGLTMNRSLSA